MGRCRNVNAHARFHVQKKISIIKLFNKYGELQYEFKYGQSGKPSVQYNMLLSVRPINFVEKMKSTQPEFKLDAFDCPLCLSLIHI